MSDDLLYGFNPNEVPPSTGGGGHLPASDKNGHKVIITDHENVTNRDATTGSHIAATLQIVEGEFAGTTGIHRFNLGHRTKAEAVNIARGEVSAICHCVGHMSPLNSLADLYNRPFRVVVEVDAKSDKGYTSVKRFLDVNGNKPGQAATNGPAPGPSAAPAPTAGGFPAPQPQQPQQPQQAAPQAPQQQFPVQQQPVQQQAPQVPQQQYQQQIPQQQYQQQIPQVPQQPPQGWQPPGPPVNAPMQQQAPGAPSGQGAPPSWAVPPGQ